MNTDSLRLFVEVARLGSFAAVARPAGLDPSSVSRAIAGLESELGLRLFQRSTRRVTLTEAGDLYLHRVEAIVEELERARDEALAVSAGPSGTLRLTTSTAFGHTCLLPLIPAFRAAFPALKMELVLTDANLDLVAERIDLAIRLAPSIDADVVGVKFLDTCYRVCASPDYLKATPPILAPADLARHDCLLFTLPEFRTRWLFRDARGAIQEVPVQGDLVISSAMALRDGALAGLGPALLANWLVDDDIAAGRLVDVFPDFRVAATSFETGAWLLYPSRNFLPNKVRLAIDFLRQRLGHRR